MPNTLTVREMQKEDLDLLIAYWCTASPAYLRSMGADPAKVPSADKLRQALTHQVELPMQEKQSFALIWLADAQPIGHCNVNQIAFGKQAHMHLHLWQADARRKGVGTALVRKSLPHFFDKLQLEQIICEPYAHNPAPNKTLARVGFEHTRTYRTVPGSLNFEQEVKRWVMTQARFQELENA